MMRTIRRFAVCLFTAILATLSIPSMAQITHTLPLVLSADESLSGFVRIVNHSDESGTVRITAFDNTGARFGPVTLSLDAEETVNFNSRDLERGNASKGLPVGVGDGFGDWRLVLDTDLGITPLAYIRTADGFVTAMHNVAPETATGSRRYRVDFFNPGSNTHQVSVLRLINSGSSPAQIEITGRDDAGDPAPGGTASFTVSAGGTILLSAQDLEDGADILTGRLGAGAGKWRLTVSSNRDIQVMSLLISPTGHLSDLSSVPESAGGLTLPLVLPASDTALTGFVRIINRSGQAGTVRITAIDDTGLRFGPVTLSLDAEETVNFNSRDLERGNASKGLPVGVGDGSGAWRLEFNTTLDVATLAYIRTSDGFVTAMHNVAPVTGRNHRVRFFNPGSNTRQVSRLRLTNPGSATARVEITGRDDAGDPAPGGDVGLTLPGEASRTLTAQALEAGGAGLTGRLGDGAGKWQLTVSADRDIDVMSMLRSPSGHLANLSTSPSDDAPASFAGAVPIVLDGGTISGELDSPDDADLYSVTVDEQSIMNLNGSNNIIITVFDDQGNIIAQSSTSAASEGEDDKEYNRILVKVVIATLKKGKKYFVRITKDPGALRRDYQLAKAVVKFALRKVKNFVRRDVVYGEGSASIDLSEFFAGESDAIVGSINIAPVSVSIPPTAINPWATLRVIEFTLEHVLRIDQNLTYACGTGLDYSAEVKIKLALSWEHRFSGGVDPKTYSINFGEFPIVINRRNAPRRIRGERERIAVNVAAGATESIRLTDYIVDPDGGRLIFSVSDVPRRWSAEIGGRDFVDLVLSARDGARDGTLTVSATDRDGECWNFPIGLRVDGSVEPPVVPPVEPPVGGGVCCYERFDDFLGRFSGCVCISEGDCRPYMTESDRIVSACRQTGSGSCCITEAVGGGGASWNCACPREGFIQPCLSSFTVTGRLASACPAAGASSQHKGAGSFDLREILTTE